MAGKLKNAPRSRKPRVEKPSRSSRIQVVEDPPPAAAKKPLPEWPAITEAEREGILAKLLAEKSLLAKESANPILKNDGAEQVWKRALLTNVFPPLDIVLADRTKLIAVQDGIRVQVGERLSVIPWLEIVEYCRDEFGDENDDGTNYETPPPRKPKATPESQLEDLGLLSKRNGRSGTTRPARETKPATTETNGWAGHAGPGVLGTTSPAGIANIDPDATPRRPAAKQGTPAKDELVHLQLADLERNPFQPREDFNADELRALADSIEATGLAHPIVVRWRLGDKGEFRYQVADGERRWRAFALLKRDSIPAITRELTDQQMADMAISTAEHRAALSPIELALAYELRMKKWNLSQADLGKRYGISQGQVSNTLRLLKLPKAMQKRIISREISASHARLLVPFAEAHGDFWSTLEKEMKRERGTGSLSRFENMIGDCMDAWSNDIENSHYSNKAGQSLPGLTLTDEDRAKLCIVEFRECDDDADEKPRLVATNLGHLKKLREAQEKEWIKANGRPRGSVGPGAKKKVKASPAKEFKKRLDKWKLSWRQYLIALTVEELDPSDLKGRLLLLWLTVEGRLGKWRFSTIGAKKKLFDRTVNVHDSDACLRIISSLDEVVLDGLEVEFLGEYFAWDKKKGASRESMVTQKTAKPLCELLELNLADAWRVDLAGPLTDAYWNLHSREQLVEISKQYDQLEPSPSTSVKDIIAKIMRCPRLKQEMPAELVERTKSTPAKKKAKRK